MRVLENNVDYSVSFLLVSAADEPDAETFAQAYLEEEYKGDEYIYEAGSAVDTEDQDDDGGKIFKVRYNVSDNDS